MTGRSSAEATFRAVFDAAPDAMLLADSDRRYVDANPAACRLLQRERADLLQLRVEDVTPAGVDVETAWREFLARGESQGEYLLQRPDGSSIEVDFRATAHVAPGRHLSILRDVSERRQAERERDQANARLREAYDTAHHIALTLQRAMLPPPVAIPGLQIATRYRPATDAMAIGGDWYDLRDVGRQRVAVTVGDVMGHGLAAAGIMGQLRSALAAVMLAAPAPARALGVLDVFARFRTGPLMATAFTGLLDMQQRTLTYSSAGHLPPLVLDESSRFLDQALAAPLAATPQPEERPETTVHLPPDATIVLYTDGLIERRGEDIDEGLRRLAAVGERLAHEDCETFADLLVEELRPADREANDDVAVVVIKL